MNRRWGHPLALLALLAGLAASDEEEYVDVGGASDSKGDGAEETCSADSVECKGMESSGAVSRREAAEGNAGLESLPRPCGCSAGGGKYGSGILKPLLPSDMVKCASEMVAQAAPPSMDAANGSVLALTFVHKAAQEFAQYSLSLTAAHLSHFGHALRIEDVQSKTDIQLDTAPTEGDARDVLERVARLREILKELVRSSKPSGGDLQQMSQPQHTWLLLLDPGAAVVTDTDIIRRTLQDARIDKKTHVVVSRHGRKQKKATLDTGIILLKVAAWSDGFLAAWTQELTAAASKTEQVAADAALEKAVARAKKLGGESAVVELQGAASLSSSLKDAAYANVREEPIINMRGAADEVRRAFYKASWEWACKRPGGLWGGAPAVLQRHHLHVVSTALQDIMGGSPPKLSRRGRSLRKSEYAAAVVDHFACYADTWRDAAQKEGPEMRSAFQQLHLCLDAYRWALPTDESEKSAGFRRCRNALDKLEVKE
eukprot:TRINITY_DN23407_c0_g1_i1.p1 TRINITY_DN23407_c0_g1~~TRINITY_DN23407_c0_g1_i1.p1  ORF type:complete len:486 (-),score=115.57 TRINITY_DN23407_c0_g1_i1:143-1600(-)